MIDSVTLYVLVVVFVATLIRSTLGFGEALVAVPLLVLRIPVTVAAPLAVLVSVVVAGTIVAQDWRRIQFRSAAGLVIASLFGIPLGLWLLVAADDHVVKAILGGTIVAFALYSLFAASAPHLREDHPVWLAVCGFLSGVFGGAYGMNGPPLAVYGALRRWAPQHFRATLQGYFLPASLAGLAGYWWAGLWTAAVTRYFLWSLPGVAAAIAIGGLLHRSMNGRNFLRVVYVGLLVIGVTLLVQR